MGNNRSAIINGRVIDPANRRDGLFNVFIKDGLIAEISNREPGTDADLQIIDAKGLVVVPGFIDLHVHLREPGFEYKEDIESGSKAAVAGGFTTIFCMPNTKPANDNVETNNYILKRASEVGLCSIYPVGAISKELKGEVLADIEGLANASVIAISDDGGCVQNEAQMKCAMEIAKKLHLLVISHPEDYQLNKKGCMNEGETAKRLGLLGIPREAENSIIERDIRLAKETGARLHIAHVSTKEGLGAVRRAKKDGLQVTCEVTPHHLLLTDDAVEIYGTNAKMNPPLRTEEDRVALIEGLQDGTVDAIATDHAPHSADEKAKGMRDAPFGIVGLETAFEVCMKLVDEGKITLPRLIELLTSGPARVAQIAAGSLNIGAKADITIFDPKKPHSIDPKNFKSKSRNTPFNGLQTSAQIIHTITRGRIFK